MEFENNDLDVANPDIVMAMDGMGMEVEMQGYREEEERRRDEEEEGGGESGMKEIPLDNYDESTPLMEEYNREIEREDANF